MPAPLLTRDEVLKRILEVFRHHGYAGASLTEISKATGLGRSSLYHYFPGGKEDMAQAVLELLKTWMEVNIIAELQCEKPPAMRIGAMCRLLDEFYMGGRERCILANFIMAESMDLFKETMRIILTRWIDALAKLIEETGLLAKEAKLRAEDAVVRVQGGLMLSIALNDPTPFRRALQQIEQNILDKFF